MFRLTGSGYFSKPLTLLIPNRQVAGTGLPVIGRISQLTVKCNFRWDFTGDLNVYLDKLLPRC
jgi:hypothetical protein